MTARERQVAQALRVSLARDSANKILMQLQASSLGITGATNAIDQSLKVQFPFDFYETKG